MTFPMIVWRESVPEEDQTHGGGVSDDGEV